jgi:ornithine cyclodeaminase
MPAIILTQAEVRRLLPMRQCIELMADVLSSLARGEAVNPLRSAIRLPGRSGLLGLMPGYATKPHALGLKAVTVFPDNHGTRYDAHQGLVLLFEERHGLPLAVMNASEITAVRTAAVSAVATRLLALEDADELAILGSGVQARTHLEAMLEVRPIRRVRVFSPTAEHRERFAERESKRHGVQVEAAGSAHAAVRGASIVCTTTSSKEPVLHGEWIEPGTHVNAVGSSMPSARELDGYTVARARLFVDRRESALNEAGDYLFAQREGRIGESHILGEIGDLLVGGAHGRYKDVEITLFKSLGLAVEDLAAAAFVHRQAIEQGVGTTVELDGLVD